MTELTELSPLLAEEKALTALIAESQSGGSPILDDIDVDPGFETALAAALGDDLSLATDDGAAAFWRSLAPLAQTPALPGGVSSLADHISTTHDVRPSFHDGLKEMDFGVWEGMRWDDVPVDELNIWANDLLHARPHGGESVFQMQVRALAALDAHDAWRPDTATLVVTHAGVIRAVLDHIGVRDAWVTQTPYGGGWVISADNAVTALQS